MNRSQLISAMLVLAAGAGSLHAACANGRCGIRQNTRVATPSCSNGSCKVKVAPVPAAPAVSQTASREQVSTLEVSQKSTADERLAKVEKKLSKLLKKRKKAKKLAQSQAAQSIGWRTWLYNKLTFRSAS